MKHKEVDDLSHRKIQDLLPWCVNETLRADEREQVAAHLAECSACRMELEKFQVLQRAVKSSNERLPNPSDGQLEALVSRIEKSESERSRKTISVSGSRLKAWWVSLPALARAAILSQAVVLIVLAGVSMALLRRAARWETVAIQERQRAELNESLLASEKQRADEYQALSGQAADSGGPGMKIKVAFREDASEKEIRTLLLNIKATIVSGPSPARFYVLRLIAPPDADAQSLMNDALAQLRRRNDLVQLAEPMP